MKESIRGPKIGHSGSQERESLSEHPDQNLLGGAKKLRTGPHATRKGSSSGSWGSVGAGRMEFDFSKRTH